MSKAFKKLTVLDDTFKENDELHTSVGRKETRRFLKVCLFDVFTVNEEQAINTPEEAMSPFCSIYDIELCTINAIARTCIWKVLYASDMIHPGVSFLHFRRGSRWITSGSTSLRWWIQEHIPSIDIVYRVLFVQTFTLLIMGIHVMLSKFILWRRNVLL